MAEAGDAKAPAYGQQEDELVEGVEAGDHGNDQIAHADRGGHSHRRQRYRHLNGNAKSAAGFRVGQRRQHQQRKDRNHVLNQKQADDQLADVAMVQNGGRQQLDAENGAREHGGNAGDAGFGQREAEAIEHRESDREEGGGTAECRQHRLAEQVLELVRRQVEADEIEQEDDADLPDLRQQGGVRHQRQGIGAQHATYRDVGNQERLARVQSERRQHRRADEDDEERLDDAGFHAAQSLHVHQAVLL